MNDDAEADIRLAYDLLAGVSEDDENRRALARHLRSQQPVDTLVRRVLAALFYPQPGPAPHSRIGPVERRLVFKNPRGSTHDHNHALKIADEVLTLWQRDGGTKTDAILAVAEKNNVEQRTIERALELWRSKFQPLDKFRLEEAI